VINSSVGEFESGFVADGQTKEHALLVRSLGVSQLIVAVNKLDTVEWSQARYNEIVGLIGHFLKQIGFRDNCLSFIPLSGYTGDNLTTRSNDARLTAWYSGNCLLEQIDAFEAPPRETERPFRMCITDIFKSLTTGVTVAGKIESGVVASGDTLALVPGTETCTVKGISSDGTSLEWAEAGANVEIGLTGIEQANLRVGSFLCDPEHPIVETPRFQAQIIVFSSTFPIIQGHPIVLHTQSLNEPGNITKLIKILDKAGAVTQKTPRYAYSRWPIV